MPELLDYSARRTGYLIEFGQLTDALTKLNCDAEVLIRVKDSDLLHFQDHAVLFGWLKAPGQNTWGFHVVSGSEVQTLAMLRESQLATLAKYIPDIRPTIVLGRKRANQAWLHHRSVFKDARDAINALNQHKETETDADTDATRTTP